MPRSVKITKTNTGGNPGPFTIYHTAVAPENILDTLVSKASLEAGWAIGDVPDAYVNFMVVGAGPCTATSNTAYSPSDTTPPSTVTSLTAIASPCYITLEWNASTDDSGGAVAYDVYRSGIIIASGVSALIYDDYTYDRVFRPYYIVAVDASGNRSANGNQLNKAALLCA